MRGSVPPISATAATMGTTERSTVISSRSGDDRRRTVPSPHRGRNAPIVSGIEPLQSADPGSWTDPSRSTLVRQGQPPHASPTGLHQL
jgi:hypothetical protein